MIAERTRHNFWPSAAPIPHERLSEYESRRDGTSDFYLSRRLTGEAIQRVIRTRGWSRALPQLRRIRDAISTAPAVIGTPEEDA